MTLRLEIVTSITGLGAASGLCLHDGTVYMVSDNATFLYAYSLSGAELRKIPLGPDARQYIHKKQKPDFEALVLYDDRIEAYGSGSLPNRRIKAVYDLKTREVALEDISPLYRQMQSLSDISEDDFNIEGVVPHDDVTYFFQRGNGAGGRNGIFTLSGDDLSYRSITLPEIGGVLATFTDATIVEDTIYFLAAAEASESTFHDGEILGSLVGTINPESGVYTILGILPGQHKFEGLAFEAKTEGGLSFLLCEDDDSESTTSTLYRLVISN